MQRHTLALWVSMVFLIVGGGCTSSPPNPTRSPTANPPAPDPSAKDESPGDSWSFDGAQARVSPQLPELRLRLATMAEYSDGCSQTTIFGHRRGQMVLEVDPNGRVIAGFQSVSDETSGPGVGGSGAWTHYAWLHTWFYTGEIADDELEDGVLDVTLQPAANDACDDHLPSGWQPYEPYLNAPPGCSQATAPLVLSCVEQRHRLPSPAAASGRTLTATQAVDVVVCEIDGSPHADLIGPGGKLFLSAAPGLELTNTRDDNVFLGHLDGPLSDSGVLTFDPTVAP